MTFRICLIAFTLSVAVPVTSVAHDEQALKNRYDEFVEMLDTKQTAKDYPKALERLDSEDPKEQLAGMKTLAATGDIEAIPWIVPFLDSDDQYVQVYAGLHIQQIVSGHELKRRDMSQPENVVINPRGPEDADLTPLAWVVLKMLQKPDDGSTHSYAATMIGYLGLKAFESDLRQLLKSRHPAVTTSAKYAMGMLGYETNGGFSNAQMKAARETAESFARLFFADDEDSLVLLLLPKKLVPEVLSKEILAENDPDKLYARMVEGNLKRFAEYHSIVADTSRLTIIGFEAGRPVESEFYRPNVRVMENSYATLAYANRVIVKLKIEEMVFVGDQCFIVEID